MKLSSEYSKKYIGDILDILKVDLNTRKVGKEEYERLSLLLTEMIAEVRADDRARRDLDQMEWLSAKQLHAKTVGHLKNNFR